MQWDSYSGDIDDPRGLDDNDSDWVTRPHWVTGLIRLLYASAVFFGLFAVIAILAYTSCDPADVTPLGGSGQNCPGYALGSWLFGVPSVVCLAASEVIRRRWPR